MFSKRLMINLPLLRMSPPFLHPLSYLTAQISLYGIQAESYKDDETKTQITSTIRMACPTNLDISRLCRVFAVPFFKPEYKKNSKTSYHPTVLLC